MRISVTILMLLMLTACESTAERTCAREGYADGTPEFRECVSERRVEGSVRMKEKAAGGGLQRRRVAR